MKNSRLLSAICACAVTLVTSPSYAALIGVLPATPGGTDYQAYYDDVADLTWLADANAGGSLDYDGANAWAAGLDIDGVTGWRLPTTLQPDASCSFQGTVSAGVNCTGSEMGNLYYNVLGNAAGGPLTSTGPFSNVQSTHYWSATEYALVPTNGWYFGFDDGNQLTAGKAFAYGAWAVQSGNAGAALAPVPVPAAVWLFGSGLLGLIGVARRRNA